MKKRAVLIDGTNMFCMHYAANPFVDSLGNPVGGTRGTLNALKNLTETLKPDIIYFFLDGPGGSRKKRSLYKEYKDGRKPIAGRHFKFESPQEAKNNRKYQISCLKKFIQTLPVCLVETEDCEADDAIGYIVSNYEYFGHSSNIIVSCDKDYYQLISPKTVIYNPQSKKLIDTEFMIKKYGTHPKNWLFVKSINGDPSDNIKGVKGIGPKTIAKLFSVSESDVELDISSIEKMYNFGDCGFTDSEVKKYTKLYENIDLVKQNWELMSLKNPLISSSKKDWITKVIEKYTPQISQKEFLLLMRKTGIVFDLSYLNYFKTLV